MSRTSSGSVGYGASIIKPFVSEFTFWRGTYLRHGKLWNQSQSSIIGLPRLAIMGVKYYTHFVLTGEAEADDRQEFSGVVEVNQTTETRFEPQEIEALLARNFDLDSNDVRLINWSRLQ